MQRLFILGLAFIVCLGMALGATLFISLLPFFHQIGIATLCLLVVAIACATCITIAFTYTRIQIMLSARNHSRLMSRVIVRGDVVAALDYTGNWQHLSSIHEAAKVPPPQPLQIAAPTQAKPEPYADEELIMELWQHGSTLQTIVESTGMPYNAVQRITSDAKKSGAKRSKKVETAEE